jgi:hypothetical protein
MISQRTQAARARRSPAPIVPGSVAVVRWGVSAVNRGIAAIIAVPWSNIIAVPWSAIIAVPWSAIVTVTGAIGVCAGRYATDHRASN